MKATTPKKQPTTIVHLVRSPGLWCVVRFLAALLLSFFVGFLLILTFGPMRPF
jgi:hypothetical protein